MVSVLYIFFKTIIEHVVLHKNGTHGNVWSCLLNNGEWCLCSVYKLIWSGLQ